MQHELAALRVEQAAEVAALLARLRDSAAPVVLAAPSGASLSARLWSLDAEAGRLHFEVDADSAPLNSLLTGNEATALSSLDMVQLQFTLHDLVLVRGASATTLQTDWPPTLLRLQRRESFRVAPRQGPSLTLRHPSLPDMELALRLLDVSIGGCAFLLPHDVPELQPGSRIHGVRVQLDLETRFDGGVLLHHVSAFDGAEGPRRVGCAWDQLEASAERALQRYILRTQMRQRRLVWV